MNAERLLDALGRVDDAFVEEAASEDKKAVHRRQLKHFSVAACLMIAVITVVIGWQNNLFGVAHTAVLDDGSRITFKKSGDLVVSQVIDMKGNDRELTQDEIRLLLGDVSGTVTGHFDEEHNLKYVEGWIGDHDIRISASVTDMGLMYIEPEKKHEKSPVNGVPVLTGYVISEGVKGMKWGEDPYIYYYALIEQGDVTVYLEHSGQKKKREDIRQELAEMIDWLTERGIGDLEAIQE